MILNKNEAVLLLGTNLGDRISFLEETKRQISQNIGSILSKSHIYESASWGYKSANYFLNQVVIVDSKYTPLDIFLKTQKIEQHLGKTSNSKVKYSDRPIDIDILFFDNQIVNKENLCIPHPEIQNRRFTLIPLCDVLSNYKHPILNKNMEQLLDNCKDQIEPTLYRG